MSKETRTKSPDSLTKTAGIALAESELDKVTGGDVTLNKVKVAEKNAQQADACLRQ